MTSKEQDLESYFECSKLRAKLKLRACESRMLEERAKLLKSSRSNTKYPTPCTGCAGWTASMVTDVESQVFEDKVLADLGGDEVLVQSRPIPKKVR